MNLPGGHNPDLRASRLVYSIIGMRAPINKPIVRVTPSPMNRAFTSTAYYEPPPANHVPESIGLSKSRLVLASTRAPRLCRGCGNWATTDGGAEQVFEEFKGSATGKRTSATTTLRPYTSNISHRQILQALALIYISGSATNNCVIRLEDGILEDVALGTARDAAYNAIDKMVDAPAYAGGLFHTLRLGGQDAGRGCG